MLPIILFQLFFALQPTPSPFTAQTIDDNIEIGYGIALGDVDGDGKTDILLADKTKFVWYRNGDWKKFVMIEHLTERDNVCIAAKDIDGDGKVEVAVGAQWNPGETSDAKQSGSVHYLIRPKDPTQLWTAVELPHEVTIHRMKWVKGADDKYYLVVLPLHGKDNKNGDGTGVKMLAYQFPKDVTKQWNVYPLDTTLHLTHNFDILSNESRDRIFIASKEGIKFLPELNINTMNAQSLKGVVSLQVKLV
ncbi:MAG: VCBS repeat-containing protein [Agriterribacter sp.]